VNDLLPAPHIGLVQLSSYAAEWDWLFVGMVLLSVFFLVPIVAAIVYFAIKYRKGSPADRSQRVRHRTQIAIELSWTIIPFVLTLIFFVWAARMYVSWATPPNGALEINVVGKQWMWKFQHPGGQREINALHVPAGRPVKLLLTSQDVVHALFLPELRIKRDAIPGRITTLWFIAEKPGTYRINCTEFCGTDHSAMTGQLTVLGEAEYQAWLSQAGTDLSLAAAGEQLFRRYGCSGCHGANSTVHAPSLGGLFGSVVHTTDGRALTADEQYIRDCLLLPNKNRVAGYPPVMPNFQGQIGEDDLLKLIAFIRSLPAGARP
jgi:cytochrome c oxidase subunit II